MPEASWPARRRFCYALRRPARPTTTAGANAPAPWTSELLEDIIGNVKAATQNALDLVRSPPAPGGARKPRLPRQSALELAIWSDRAAIPASTRERLRPILGRYLDPKP